MNRLIFDRTSSPTFFSTLRTGYLLITVLLTKRRTCAGIGPDWHAGSGWVGQEDMHAICPLHVAGAESLDSEKVRGHSGHMHNATEFFFLAHFTVCTHGKQVCVKRAEGGDKDFRIHFEGKPGEDSLRPNSRCSVSHTCLSVGFSRLASPNPCFQRVSLPRSRST